MTTVLADYPAYKVIGYEGNELANGATIALPFKSKRYGTQYRRFILGNVAHFAIANGGSSADAVKRARENGHDLYYAFPVGAMVTNTPRPKEDDCIGVEFGSQIKYVGRTFVVEKAPNDNVRLREVDNRI